MQAQFDSNFIHKHKNVTLTKITNPNPLLRMGVMPSMLGVCAVTTKTAAPDVRAFMRGWDRKEVMKPI